MHVFRGKSSMDGVETYGVVLTSGLAVAICGDTCLRAWPLDESGAPIAVSTPLSQTQVRPKPPRKLFHVDFYIGRYCYDILPDWRG